jgi:signal transduction histidine kinase/tetratricopeptide (TPR) repeat protein
MRFSAWKRILPSSGHRLPAVFVICLLLPGVTLAVLGLRALRQQRQLADQQIRENIEATAARVGADLEREFRQWQDSVKQIAASRLDDPDDWPEKVRLVLRAPGNAVVLSTSGGNLQAYPPQQLLYNPGLPEERQQYDPPSSSSLRQAENLELRQKDYANAIRIYTTLLKTATPQSCPFYLQRVARCYRTDGRLDEALEAYRKLAELEPVRVGPAPTDLIADFEICSLMAERGDAAQLAVRALEFYRDLIESRWRLGKQAFSYDMETAEAWLRNNSNPPERMKDLEQLKEKKLALTEAAEALIEHPRHALPTSHGSCLAFWTSEPFTALVLSPGFLESGWVPRIFEATKEKGLLFNVSSSDGELLFGSSASGAQPFEVVRTLQMNSRTWHLQMWPQDPGAVYAGLKRTQNFYLAVLVVMTALLGFGGYITIRTVKREIEVARMRADFVSTVSHEFRSPLAGILQLGEMLLDDRVKDEVKKHGYYRMIVQESKRLGSLVENLLDFSRMEEGRKEYNFAPLNTARWLRELADAFRQEAAAHEFTLEADIPAALPEVTGDAEALTCAVHNLLDNAVKYSPGARIVRLGAGSANGQFSISVQDCGIGISEPDRRRIFEKFYRVDGRLSRKVKGVGLGLSLVKHIVTAHGGDVECASCPGEGSTFTIHLPIAQPAQEK